jgi:type III restriction enzyme
VSEVGNGLRLCVIRAGPDGRSGNGARPERGDGAAAEGYKELVAGMQKKIAEAISARPRRTDLEYFTGKIVQTEAGDVPVTPARQRQSPLSDQERPTGNDDKITAGNPDAKAAGTIALLPPELAPYSAQIYRLLIRIQQLTYPGAGR